MVGAGAVHKGDAAVVYMQVDGIGPGIDVVIGILRQVDALFCLGVAVAHHRDGTAAMVGGEP